ncbi:MAG: AAA family ATPase [Planctomycetes bacterium]|nr:AAA family ATPase [Planctomycetota bacterium]
MTEPIDPELLSRLRDPELDPATRSGLISSIAESSPTAVGTLYEMLYRRCRRQQRGTELAEAALAELRAKIDAFREPAIGAVFLGIQSRDGGGATGSEVRARVIHGNTMRLVDVDDDVDAGSLVLGRTVYLNSDLSRIVDLDPDRPIGQLVTFEAFAGAGRDRAVVKAQGEETVARLGPDVASLPLSRGDSLLWVRPAGVVTEKIEAVPSESTDFIESIPDVTFDDIGGLEAPIARIRHRLTLRVRRPDLAERYALPRGGSILLVGKPGNGKTMIAKAIANELREITGSSRVRFVDVKPSALHSSWYSESERAYRRLFERARDESRRDPSTPIVIFMDEIDGVGRARGSSVNGVTDRVLLALAAELDGMSGNENIIVVAATNRREDLDPALVRPGRLGDLVIDIPPPDRRGAERILAKVLAPLPCVSERDESGESVREEFGERLVSRLFGSSADRELATINLRDGTSRRVSSSDLISGAMLRNLVARAAERASIREIEGASAGLRIEDLVIAAAEELESAASVLTPSNCATYVDGLPPDVPVVRVDRPASFLREPIRYRGIA